jgi:hypothetical protein
MCSRPLTAPAGAVSAPACRLAQSSVRLSSISMVKERSALALHAALLASEFSGLGARNTSTTPLMTKNTQFVAVPWGGAGAGGKRWGWR